MALCKEASSPTLLLHAFLPFRITVTACLPLPECRADVPLPVLALALAAREWRSTLGDPNPLMIIDSHGIYGNWTDDSKLRPCVFQSFGCASKWCLDSRQLSLFLGAPTELLGDALRATTLVRPPSTQDPLPTHRPLAPLQDWQHTTLQFARALAAAQQSVEGYTLAQGGTEAGEVKGSRGAVIRKRQAQGGERDQAAHPTGYGFQEGAYSRSAAQARESLKLRLLGRDRSRRSTRRLLQIHEEGTGASSRQSVSKRVTRGRHSAPPKGRESPRSADAASAGADSQGLRSGAPSSNVASIAEAGREGPGSDHALSAEFRTDDTGPGSWTSEAALQMEFDVGIHIRTVTPCIERGLQSSLCSSPGLNHTLTWAYKKKGLRAFLLAKDWLCVSSLLSYLHNLKAQLAQERAREEGPRAEGAASLAQKQLIEGRQGPQDGPSLEGDHRAGGGPLIHFPEGSPERRRMEAFLKTASPGRVSGLWTVGDALAFARGTLAPSSPAGGVGGEAHRLRIYLATDNEFLRPLFAELLRPFGHVVVSNSVLAHTAAWGRRVLGLPQLGAAKIVSLSEFFLLSKAAVALNFGSRRSSFLTEAAKYGNTTLILRGKLPHHRACDCPCCYSVDHWAELPTSQQR